MQTTQERMDEFCGVVPFPHRGGVVTDELIDKLREEDFEEEVSSSSDLAGSLASLPSEAELEVLRRERHSVAARNLVAQAVQQAQADKETGFDWDTSFQTLREQHMKITASL